VEAPALAGMERQVQMTELHRDCDTLLSVKGDGDRKKQVDRTKGEFYGFVETCQRAD
jgi:hypothetical protein